MTGTISFPSSAPVTYPFPGSYPNPIPDSYPIPNFPIWRVRQKKDLRETLVSFALTISTDFKHESYPSTPLGRKDPSKLSCQGDSQILTDSFFMVPVVAFNDARFEKTCPSFLYVRCQPN
jgi:hypothetical protein